MNLTISYLLSQNSVTVDTDKIYLGKPIYDESKFYRSNVANFEVREMLLYLVLSQIQYEMTE